MRAKPYSFIIGSLYILWLLSPRPFRHLYLCRCCQSRLRVVQPHKLMSASSKGKGKGDVLFPTFNAGLEALGSWVKGGKARRSPSASPDSSRVTSSAQQVGTAPATQDVAWDKAECADGAEEEVASQASQTSSKVYTALMMLPILMAHASVRLRNCKLCDSCCSSPSPLSSATQDDKYGGFRPWQQYMVAKLAGMRQVKGDICLLCWLVYKELGSYLSSHHIK